MTVIDTAVMIPAQREPVEPATTNESWALVQRCQAGDVAAFGLIYERYRDPVFRFVYFRVGHRALAEDLTADAFLRAFKRIGSFTWQGRDLGAWLMTIARNLTADHFKSGRYRLEVTTGEVLDDDTRTDPDRTDVVTETNSLVAAVQAAIETLGIEQRTAVQLRYLDGLTVTETAQAMGKQEGAVKALCYRAMRTLARTGELEAWR